MAKRSGEEAVKDLRSKLERMGAEVERLIVFFKTSFGSCWRRGKAGVEPTQTGNLCN